MPELSLESLARRVEALEHRLAQSEPRRKKDWRRAIGMFADSEFMKDVNDEANKIREADREAGRNRTIEDEPS